MSKYSHIADIDISTLETIYADGRAMGRLVQDFKEDLAKALLEISMLKTELRTMHERLKREAALLKQALEENPGPKPPLLKARIKRIRPRLYRC